MKIAHLTKNGITVDMDELQRLGPVESALKMFNDLTSNKIECYSVKYKGKKSVHIVIDSKYELEVLCGLPAEGEAVMWKIEDKIPTCKECIKKVKDY